MVIAPHPDDETLGCGGLISCLAAEGRRVHVVFVTDGGASHRNSPTWPRERLVRCREAEATEALRHLGLKDQPPTFLHLRDSAMPRPGTTAYRAVRDRLAGLIASIRPDLALLPWRRDPHCDHRDSWCLAQDAIAAAGASPTVLEYAIWLDELGGEGDAPDRGEARRVDFDIRSAVAAKCAAIAAHRSQTTNLIADDPQGFRLSEAMVARLTGPSEPYWLAR